MVVSLSGLPSCLGTSDAIVNTVCEAFGNGFPIVKVTDALFVKGAIFHCDRKIHPMQIPTFVAKGKDTVLSCRAFYASRHGLVAYPEF
jgi:hypothetical protein